MVDTPKAEYMRAWRAANADRLREYQRQYNAAHVEERRQLRRAYFEAHLEEERAAGREYQRARRAADPVGVLAKERAAHLANPEKRKAAWDRWYAKNAVRLAQKAKDNREQTNAWARQRRRANLDAEREKGRNQQARRKAKGRAFRVLPRDWSRMLARYDNRCAYCGERKRLTQEHVIPLKRGGRHSIGNLLPACQSCNSSKGKRLLIEWRAA